MKNQHRPIFFIVIALGLSGCAHHGYSQIEMNRIAVPPHATEASPTDSCRLVQTSLRVPLSAPCRSNAPQSSRDLH